MTTCAFGLRGRASYRGDSQYRNDWGVFAGYRFGLGDNDQVNLGGEMRERRYPSAGRCASAPATSPSSPAAGPTRSPNGRTSLSFGGNWHRSGPRRTVPMATRPSGASTARSTTPSAITSTAFFWWSYVNEAYDDERPDFTTDEDLLAVRNDDLWNFGGGLVWDFSPGWSLRPTVEYNWEDSSIDALAYSSTELWVTVRKSF